MKIIEYILGGIIGIIAAINVPKWSKLNWKEKLLLIGGIVFAVFVAYNGINEYSENNFLKKINASYGDLDDVENAITPAIGIGMGDDAPKLQTNQAGTFNLQLNNVNLKNLLKVYIKNNRLYVNMIVYDSNGLPALGIFENAWKVYKNDYEYNYDNHAIELVTNGTHEVLFHLELEKGVAHIEGSLYISKNDNSRINGFKGIKIFGSKDKPAGLTPLSGGQKDIDSSIAPIFKYPKEKYLGVMAHY